ncbi:hypothetical protein B0T11DRAFT_1776 [Plectosphaerella cucumerina]|uniref:Uncharacterized protein n=1 Tax=Plectosphaerella cucumerina TaxID=40658 RepID=A0A8K0TLW7_9PEZI|nr:hypothetical protein B0T11DRAFT_1776 [Plectosphaerella cucumerina]
MRRPTRAGCLACPRGLVYQRWRSGRVEARRPLLGAEAGGGRADAVEQGSARGRSLARGGRGRAVTPKCVSRQGAVSPLGSVGIGSFHLRGRSTTSFAYIPASPLQGWVSESWNGWRGSWGGCLVWPGLRSVGTFSEEVVAGGEEEGLPGALAGSATIRLSPLP